MNLHLDLAAAQAFLREHSIGGWLLHDYRGNNPIFWRVLGQQLFTTRRVFLFIPAAGQPQLLTHRLEASHFAPWGLPAATYASRVELIEQLRSLLAGVARVAMEYSPEGLLPASSWVDAGTLEMIRALGVPVVSSAEVFQFAAARWDAEELASHRRAVAKLWACAQETFTEIGRRANTGWTEYDLQQFMLERFALAGLTTDEGPIVAVNAHTSDPHYLPSKAGSAPIRSGDWLLIDFWAKETDPAAIYADMTWVLFLGKKPPERHQAIFRIVAEARDAAVAYLRHCVETGYVPQGREADRVARDFIAAHGYGNAFIHRLGHSIGQDVHGYGANLDDLETSDPRPLIPGLGFSIEPGIYLPDFGIRSEIDVYMAEDGPEITTPLQTEILCITPTL